jgi:vacuolar-type H+-ATPase subunit E/Vma4
MSLDVLMEKIKSDSLAEAKKIEEEALEQEGKIIKEAEQELQRLQEKAEADARRVAQERFQNIVTLARVEGKNMILSVKQKVMNEVFDAAFQQLTLLSPDKFRAFAGKILALNPPAEDTRLMVGRKNSQMIDPAFVAKLNGDMKAPGKFILTDNDRGFDYGFYLVTDRVEIDLTFASILRAVRDKMELQIIRNLFGKE